MSDDGRVRCGWATVRPGPDFELYRDYHDDEWGRPVRDPVALFERMSLEAFQSGLSWLIILRKRENFRRAFSGFGIETVAGYTDADVQRLMADEGIVRNRSKIEATIANARASLAAAEARLRAYEQSGVAETREALRLAELSYRSGKASLVELLDAQQAFSLTRADLIAARQARAEAAATLAREVAAQ